MYNAQDFRVQNGRAGDSARRNQSSHDGQAHYQNQVPETRGYPNSASQFGPAHQMYQAPVPAQMNYGRYEAQAGRRRQADGSRFIQSHRQHPQGHSTHMVQGDRNPHQAALRPSYRFGGGADGIDQGRGMQADNPPAPCPNPLKGNFPDPSHGGKILICHVPPGNPSNAQTLSIDPSGLNGHSSDCSDYDGPCQGGPPPPPPTCTFGAPDCNGVCGGPSVRDCKGICFDPTKTSPPNIADCAGVCGGHSEYDCAGKCFDPSKGPPSSVKDCAGVCNGTKVPDCKGVCGGTSAPDCKGVCGGTAVQDCKGVCGGTATVDCKGVCGGTSVRDCNGDCDGSAFKDCNGRCITSNCTFDGGKLGVHNFRQPVQNSRPRQRFSSKNE